MASILDLRRRIRSVRNTRQITKAMKMVSAAKLRRAQEHAMNARPYAMLLASVLNSLRRRLETYDAASVYRQHPLLVTRPEKRVLLIVVAGDKGFAGAFNTNITRAASNFIHENDHHQIDIEPIGRKARDHFRRAYNVADYFEQVDETTGAARRVRRNRGAGIEVTGDHPGVLQKLTFEEAHKLSEEVVARYAEAEIDAVYIVYNEFKSVIQQRVVVEKLLPLLEFGKRQLAAVEEMSREEKERAAVAGASAGISPYVEEDESAGEKFGTEDVDYTYEEDPMEIFSGLLPQYVASQIYHAMLESVAAEHAARMTAMDAATSNASEMIDDLTLTMNRVRQAAITKEIIEIVSGASAIG
jgi:F-type H+-transporting ATPase subunit gamma